MKPFFSLAAVTAVVILVLTNAPPALARSGWGLEDPQLCVNGQLLVVVPAAPAEVFVQVSERATVSFDVVSCGGNPKEDVVLTDHVLSLGGNMMRVTALAPDGTTVTFAWGGQTVNVVADQGVATAKFATK